MTQKETKNQSRKFGKMSLGRILQYVYIYFLTILVLFPVINIFVSAFKTNKEIMRCNIFPVHLQFQNFAKVMKQDIFYSGLFNSIVITAGALALSTILAALASYPLSKNKQKKYLFIYMFFLSANMIPAVANLIPLYTIMSKLHLINTRMGMILLYASRLSMGVLLFTSFFKTIPNDMAEAAEMDGCNYIQAFFRVLFPMLKPVSITYIMINILGIWNDFLLPQLFLSQKSKQPITLAVYTFSNENGSDWGAIFALMSLAVLIPMFLFIFNQKYFFKGMAVGAVKG